MHRRLIWTFAGLDAGDHLGGLASGLVSRHHAVPADLDPPRLATRAGLDEVHPASGRIDTNAPDGPGAFNQSLSEDCLEAFARMRGLRWWGSAASAASAGSSSARKASPVWQAAAI